MVEAFMFNRVVTVEVCHLWFFVEDLADLAEGQAAGETLMGQIYNNLALDKRRTKCLLSSATEDPYTVMSGLSESGRDNYYEFTFSTWGPATDGTVDTTTPTEGSWTTMSQDTTTSWPYTTTTAYDEVSEVGEPDNMCCGIGFGGVKYNTAEKECCDDGTTALFGECPFY